MHKAAVPLGMAPAWRPLSLTSWSLPERNPPVRETLGRSRRKLPIPPFRVELGSSRSLSSVATSTSTSIPTMINSPSSWAD